MPFKSDVSAKDFIIFPICDGIGWQVEEPLISNAATKSPMPGEHCGQGRLPGRDQYA